MCIMTVVRHVHADELKTFIGKTCGNLLVSLCALEGHWQQCVDQRLPGVSRALNFLLWHVLGFFGLHPRAGEWLERCSGAQPLQLVGQAQWFQDDHGGMQAVVWSMVFNLSPFVTLNCGTEGKEAAIHKLLVSSGVRELAAFPSPLFFQ